MIQGGFGAAVVPVEVVPVRYCLYARKSMESEEAQVLSIDSQINEMRELAKKENLEIVELKRESHSAKEAGARPVFNELPRGKPFPQSLRSYRRGIQELRANWFENRGFSNFPPRFPVAELRGMD